MLETSALMIDVCTVSAIGSGLWIHFETKHDPSVHGIVTFLVPLIVTCGVIKYASLSIFGVCAYRAYTAWQANKLTIASKTIFHIFL